MVVRDTSPARQSAQATALEPFANMMAASQMSSLPFVNYEAFISRAAMVAAETPVVRLPDRKACLNCPHAHRRYPAIPVCTDATVFEDLVVGPVKDRACLAAMSPPKTLAGVDVGRGPHEPVAPGYDDLARIVDPAVLAEGLYFNHILPECACTQALFDAADHDGYCGVRLDFLRQEAALKARLNPPALPSRTQAGNAGAAATPS